MMTESPDMPYWMLEWLPTIMSPSTIILFVSILVLSGTRRCFRICSGSAEILSLSEETVFCYLVNVSGCVFKTAVLKYNYLFE